MIDYCHIALAFCVLLAAGAGLGWLAGLRQWFRNWRSFVCVMLSSVGASCVNVWIIYRFLPVWFAPAQYSMGTVFDNSLLVILMSITVAASIKGVLKGKPFEKAVAMASATVLTWSAYDHLLPIYSALF